MYGVIFCVTILKRNLTLVIFGRQAQLVHTKAQYEETSQCSHEGEVAIHMYGGIFCLYILERILSFAMSVEKVDTETQFEGTSDYSPAEKGTMHISYIQ